MYKVKKLSMVNLHNRAQSINTTGPLGQSQTNDNFKSDKVDETARIDTMQISKISREIHL